MIKEPNEPTEEGLVIDENPCISQDYKSLTLLDLIGENPYVSQDYKNSLILLDLNLKVATIAGWTDIEEWNPNALKKTFQGTNLAHPELGKFVPEYVESLDAIAKVFRGLNLQYQLRWLVKRQEGFAADEYSDFEFFASSEAIALCKLLIAIDPTPAKAKTKRIQVEETSEVIEAVFI